MMKAIFRYWRPVAGMMAASFLITIVLFEKRGTADDNPAVEDPEEKTVPVERLTVDQARARARTLQTTYEASLLTMHRYYFDEDERERIPAKSMEDVFEVVDAKTGSQTQWISVSAPPMNVDNEPDTEFEKQAAKALKDGQSEFERVEDGIYARAGAIALRGGCLKCHLSALSESVDEQPVAGIVIRIPVAKE